ncbi:hypothetical protein TRAPUB_3993 [Trametes pubescens]|uniref:Uncharacterized protein n=1 Tax=Trametes pubescens TaxID=154538 RepID=A0A1M2VC53_TRAPU|nr:hypothetical protein TRAPUB_3993 [Trametes pubescens]
MIVKPIIAVIVGADVGVTVRPNDAVNVTGDTAGRRSDVRPLLSLSVGRL